MTSGPVLVRAGDLAALLTDLQEGDVLFIDEIHRLHRSVEEVLYPAMEDAKLDILIGKGPTARSIRLDLPRFTLIGATTRTGLVSSPLRDRFGFVGRLDLYHPSELRAIVERSARILGVQIDEAGAVRIAERSRGTPRIANRLLRRVRDFVEVRGDGVIDGDAANRGLVLFGVDDLGLDKLDRAILDALVPALRRPSGRAHDARPVRGGGARHHRGRLRAVSPPTGPDPAHPPGPGGDRAGLGRIWVSFPRWRPCSEGPAGPLRRRLPSWAWSMVSLLCGD